MLFYKMTFLHLVIILAISLEVIIEAQWTRVTFSTTDDPYIPPNKTSGYHKALLQEFVEVFSDGDAEKKNILTTVSNSTQPQETSDCYTKAFDRFKSQCLYYYYQTKTVDAFKIFFHRLCESKWLQTDTIIRMISKTCAEKPYLQH